jgi:glutathione S-transferase
MKDGAPVILHQFRHSHFNEKARWALDWKRVPHRRRSHLPGPHALAMLRLSGQTATPVLELDGARVAGSARILDALERRFPEPALFPEDPALRQRALAIQDEFDREVGPAVRTALFSALIREPDYLCRLFAEGEPAWVQSLYRAGFPVLGRGIARANGTTDAGGVERAFARTQAALDQVVRGVGPSGFLVGERFGVSDLCCAALLAIVAEPDHPDMAWPPPVPDRVEAFLARWRAHPAVAWVREQYARHRPPSCAVA